MGEAAVRRVELETDMRRALNAGWADFRVHYQPIVDLDSGLIRGVEALIRWEHPSRGMLPPDEFLSIAEETGLMLPLGRWILRESCATVATWRRSIPAMEELSLSVNLSSKQVEAEALVADVEEALGVTGLAPAALTLELTEDVLVSDVDAVERGLRSLADIGVRLSVDDFGTGKSPMRYLARFPITELKIDKSYVDELATADGNVSLVQGMIALGRAMRFQIVAEGIEHRRQAWSLRAMSCHRGQGYLFARPQDAAAIELVLLAQAVRAQDPGEGSETALALPATLAVVQA
jgi:EAL domain-containing protein (putative c-di-GMP-specific phosphodiesterase class I)